MSRYTAINITLSDWREHEQPLLSRDERKRLQAFLTKHNREDLARKVHLKISTSQLIYFLNGIVPPLQVNIVKTLLNTNPTFAAFTGEEISALRKAVSETALSSGIMRKIGSEGWKDLVLSDSDLTELREILAKVAPNLLKKLPVNSVVVTSKSDLKLILSRLAELRNVKGAILDLFPWEGWQALIKTERELDPFFQLAFEQRRCLSSFSGDLYDICKRRAMELAEPRLIEIAETAQAPTLEDKITSLAKEFTGNIASNAGRLYLEDDEGQFLRDKVNEFLQYFTDEFKGRVVAIKKQKSEGVASPNTIFGVRHNKVSYPRGDEVPPMPGQAFKNF